MSPKYIVGLTGGIGSGKTTVANLFADLGIELVDADIVAREVVEPSTKGYLAIVDHFGKSILDNNQKLDRAELRKRIFSNQAEREWLNNLLHPLIRKEMLEQVNNAKSAYVIMVIPLLFENGLDSLVNRTLVVDISAELQIQRTIIRDKVSAEQVSNIIASQMPRDEKLAKADDIIENQGEIVTLKAQVLALHKMYLDFAQNEL